MTKTEIAAKKDLLIDQLIAQTITKDQYHAAVAELDLGYNVTKRGLFEMSGLRSKIHIKELALIPDLLPKIAAFVAKNYVTLGEPIEDDDTTTSTTDAPAAPESSEAPAETKAAA
jgi:hypothetical protein